MCARPRSASPSTHTPSYTHPHPPSYTHRGLQGVGGLDGQHAVGADLVQRVGNHLADRVVVAGRDGRHVLDVLAALHRLGVVPQLAHLGKWGRTHGLFVWVVRRAGVVWDGMQAVLHGELKTEADACSPSSAHSKHDTAPTPAPAPAPTPTPGPPTPSSHQEVAGLVDAALDHDGVGTGGDVLQAVADHLARQHRSGGSACGRGTPGGAGRGGAGQVRARRRTGHVREWGSCRRASGARRGLLAACCLPGAAHSST